jgi:predicted aldo/keto reductase-like oxidoreductase
LHKFWCNHYQPPKGSGYTKIYSTNGAFAALKADGLIKVWGLSTHGGKGEPVDDGYTRIYSTSYAFVAVKTHGSIIVWGYSSQGGELPH